MVKNQPFDSGRQLVLASASPRRQELLTQIGVSYQVVNHTISEVPHSGENPAGYVQRMAMEKARNVITRLPADFRAVVLGADTAVVLDGCILGKPADLADARRMLSLLSGNSHQVHSAVYLLDHHDGKGSVSTSEVTFRGMSDGEIEAYWHTGEPRDKAGAYAIQGKGAVFVARIQGSYSGVMGLPLFETARLLEDFQIPCWQPLASLPGAQQ